MSEFKPTPCRHCGAAHGHFSDCQHKYERAIATAPDLAGLWALCLYFGRLHPSSNKENIRQLIKAEFSIALTNKEMDELMEIIGVLCAARSAGKVES